MRSNAAFALTTVLIAAIIFKRDSDVMALTRATPDTSPNQLAQATRVTLTRRNDTTESTLWAAQLWGASNEAPICTDTIRVDNGTSLSEVVAIATTHYATQHILIALPWRHNTPYTLSAEVSRI
ncbi:hypothetical protein IT072_03395 [Leifsonia sp. ZF2019]|uniref:hypothetical protein n=1 Tax=Leifsonia sp. ZF2019 TaxID=2781978 RepID=UPI001CC0D827|nr:hypothetical protein [Leifsonia sp. ZF2019]UAJ80108.1 hypothetical protein IT072_03395 [Leifsonia sp. ZF2019]